MTETPWIIWIAGLPGCGKTTLAKGVYERLFAEGLRITMLQMDQRRKHYFPKDGYSEADRDKAYAMFTDEAIALAKQGDNVLMDAAAYRQSMRDCVREKWPRFAEIVVHCELEEAIRRESSRPNGNVIAGLYRKGLERKRTGKQFEGLGPVIGIDVEFEIGDKAELVIDNTEFSQEETLRKALHFLDNWLAGA